MFLIKVWIKNILYREVIKVTINYFKWTFEQNVSTKSIIHALHFSIIETTRYMYVPRENKVCVKVNPNCKRHFLYLIGSNSCLFGYSAILVILLRLIGFVWCSSAKRAITRNADLSGESPSFTILLHELITFHVLQ